MASAQSPEQLIIALEPEAASIYVRQLRMSQLAPQHPVGRRALLSSSSGGGGGGVESANSAETGSGFSERVSESFVPG